MKNLDQFILREELAVDSGGNPSDVGGEVNAAPAQPDGGSWMDVFPETAQSDPDMQKYKSADDFYKSYKSQNELVGRKGIIIPKENDDTKVWDAAYKALGRPDDPSGYKINPVEGLHPSINSSQEGIAEFQAVAHKYGLNQQQANGINETLMKAVNQIVVDHEAKQQAAMQQTEAQLRQEWGSKFDSNKSLVGKVALKVLGKEGIDALGGADGLGNNPYFNKLIYNLASQLSEDTINRVPSMSQSGPSVGDMSVDQAKRELEDMQEPTSNAYKALFDERHPKHDEIVEKRKKIYEVLYGQSS